MIEIDDLVNEFKFIGINSPQDILNKCLEICATHNLDAEAFVEEWVAFAETHLGGKLNPTIKGLETLVRKLSEHVKPTVKVSTGDIKVYSDPKSNVKSILNAYNPGNQNNDKQLPQISLFRADDQDSNSFIPASYSQSAVKTSTNYEQRTNAGSVTTTYDPNQLLQTESPFKHQTVTIRLLDECDIKNMPSNINYMFEVPESEVLALVSKVERIANILKKKYSLDEELPGAFAGSNNILYGRVRCDGSGTLNVSSVLLETIKYRGNGRIGRLNLNKLQSYTFYPGQVIAMHSHINPSNIRDTFTPDAIYSDATPDLPVKLPDIENTPLKLIVACGPFSLMDNLTYQPLQDLVKYVMKEKPDVLILVGPFVDVRHASIVNGSLAEPFRSHFETLMSGVLSPLHDTHVQVVLIPSSADAHHHNTYPTPPFDPLSKKYSNNVHMMPDPSMLSVNGVVIGVTSVDVVFHIAKTEMNYPANSPERIARFVSHLLSQQSFYPLYPPAKKLFVDQGLLEKFAKIPVMPHLLILPSNFGQFVKNVKGCVVINPERLSKGYVGGTFAQIQIYPNQTLPSIADTVTCQIIKI